MIVIWPCIEPDRRMEDMLHTMNDERTRKIIRERHNAFDAKQAWSMKLAQHVQEQIKAAWIERLVGTQAMGANARIMTVHIVMVSVSMVVMIVPMMIVMVVMAVRVLDRLGIQPAGDIGRLCVWIVKAGIEQLRCRDITRRINKRSRIERRQPRLKIFQLSPIGNQIGL